MRDVRLCLSVLAILAAGAGCDGNPTGLLPGVLDGVTGERVQEVEPNDQYVDATPAIIEGVTLLDLHGTASNVDDIDIYDLGPVSPGDRITVSVEHAQSMDLAAALFNGQHELLCYNDDRSWQTDLRPQVSVTIRHSSEHCYLALAASPAVAANRGDYRATVLREQGSVPSPRSQVLFLNFAGADGVRLPTRQAADIPPFSAARIDSSYSGRTPEMIDAIVSAVMSHFAMFNVEIRTSLQSSTVPSNASVLHFGLYDPNLLGLAENVDEYNADLTQTAIIFTDTFSLFMPLEPSLEQMAIAIANVASHEAGHLLGLQHTKDWFDLMDTTAPAMALMDMQEFRTAPLYSGIFPIGWQNGPRLLGESVGVKAVAARAMIDRDADFANTGGSAEGGPGAISNGALAGSLPAWATKCSPDVWRLLTGSHGSVQDVSKDLFAVHFRGSRAR